MQLNHESFEDLVGAFALDACDEDETAAVEAYIAMNPAAGVEVERLRAAAAWLAASGPMAPPPTLRGSVLALATDVEPASGMDVFLALTDGLERQLTQLPPEAREAETHNGLTVRELVAHLAAIDRLFVDIVRAPESRQRFVDADEVVAVTRETLADARDDSFETVLERWARTRDDLRQAALAAPADARVMGYSVDDTLVIRAFETWTHLGDIRRILDLPDFVPEAPVVRTMADLSIRVVPVALAVTGRSHPGRFVEVVLTGPGGRSWTVPAGFGETPVGEPDAIVVTDVVTWCRRFADRVEVADVRRHVTGDATLVDDVLAAAPAFTSL
jgi:uncharacterized protein (TIGR03083 family)